MKMFLQQVLGTICYYNTIILQGTRLLDLLSKPFTVDLDWFLPGLHPPKMAIFAAINSSSRFRDTLFPGKQELTELEDTSHNISPFLLKHPYSPPSSVALPYIFSMTSSYSGFLLSRHFLLRIDQLKVSGSRNKIVEP